MPETGVLVPTLRTIVLVGALGVSVGLFIWALGAGGWLSRFVAQNHLTPVARNRALAAVALAAFLPILASAGTLVAAWRRDGIAGYREELIRIGVLARVFVPALLLWAMPPLLSWKAWVGREVLFLVTTGVVVGAFERAVRVSLTATGESPSIQPGFRASA